jgi:hypothetical protein
MIKKITKELTESHFTSYQTISDVIKTDPGTFGFAFLSNKPKWPLIK